MPDLENIATYPPLKKKVEEKEIKVDKPGQFGKDKGNKAQKGVKVRVMKITKQPRARKKGRDPRNREFF